MYDKLYHNCGDNFGRTYSLMHECFIKQQRKRIDAETDIINW